MKRSADERGAIHFFELGRAPRIHVGWFSDTIFVVAQKPEGYEAATTDADRRVRAHLVDVVVKLVGYAIRSAAGAPFPMVLRGVVTVGQAAVTDDNVYLGPAINEAAELYEKAQGAFVWLSPDANDVSDVDLERALVPYPVPLKGGQVLETSVVNPYIAAIPRSNFGEPIRAGMEVAMAGDRIDIAVKRQNTMRFLDYVEESELHHD
jgi:hypothetical protein